MPSEEESDLQSILFSRANWTLGEANTYLLSHGLIAKKLAHVTKLHYRYRLQDPKMYENFRSKQLKNGVTLVYGIK